MAHETDAYGSYQIAASDSGDRLWKNVVGTFRSMDGMRCIKVGLAPSSGDLIGLTRKRMTLEDLGKEYAIFTSIEVKVEGKRTSKKRADGQALWRTAINHLGGIALQVYTVQEMKQEIYRWKSGESTSAW